MENVTIEYAHFIKKAPIYNQNLNVKYKDGYLYFLVDENNRRLSNYYSGITDLNIPDLYRVTFFFKIQGRIIKRYKVIKLKRDEEGKIIPKVEEFIMKDYCQYIKNGGEKTLLVGYNGLYTFIDIDSKSPSYTKWLYPLIFNYASTFSLEKEGYAKVNIGTKMGYIKRTYEPITSINEYDLITEEEIEKIQEDNSEKLVRKL